VLIKRIYFPVLFDLQDIAQDKLRKEKEKERLEAEAQAAESVPTVAEHPDTNLQVALEDDKSQGSSEGGAKSKFLTIAVSG
jgi:hypothetical protein